MSVVVFPVGMSSGPEQHPYPYGSASSIPRSAIRSQHQASYGSGSGPVSQSMYGQRSVADVGESYLSNLPPYSSSPYRVEPREYYSRPTSVRADTQILYIPQSQGGGIPISTSDHHHHQHSHSFAPSSYGDPSSQQFSLGSSSYGGAGHEIYSREQDSPSSYDPFEYSDDPTPSSSSRPPPPQSRSRRSRGHSNSSSTTQYPTQRKPSNRDEFDGPHQLLPPPSPRTLAAQDRELPHLPTSLDVAEQDDILSRVNTTLSKCAFDFVAKYQFPIPIEPDKRQVRSPSDREWTEWVYLLKRLATKRRIPARVLYNNQIKQLVTVLENSLEMRHAAKHQSRPLKDDRNVLQLISAGIQVAKILKDASAMEFLDQLYARTEDHVLQQRSRNRRIFTT